MTVTSTGLLQRNFAEPDETREPPLARVDLLNIGDVTIGRGVLQPGWRWSTSVKAIAGTESCEVQHLSYCVRGRLHVRMDDGHEIDVKPGDLTLVPPGHDAWVIGEEPAELLEFSAQATRTWAVPPQVPEQQKG